MKKASNPSYWRYLLNAWSVFTFAVIIWDFVYAGSLRETLGPVLAIYTAILALYSVEKEFERWYDKISGRHFGEVYVVIWTMLLLAIFIVDGVTESRYVVPSEIIATYIAVLGVLAVTKSSKQIFRRKHTS